MAQQAGQHIVKPGETLYGLSRQYNVTVDALSNANPEPVAAGLREGMVLRIPASGSLSVNATLPGPDSADAQYFYHKIQPRETLYGISKMYEVSIELLEKENPDLAGKGLQIDQVLRVPKQGKPVPAAALHTVQPGETVYSLSRKAGTTPETFFEWNPHTIDGLKEGQEVRLTAPSTSKSAADVKKQEYQLYQVKPKDDIAGLVKQFGVTATDLYALNPEIRQGLIPNRYIIIPPKMLGKQPIGNGTAVQTAPETPSKRIVEGIGMQGKKHIAVLLPFKATEQLATDDVEDSTFTTGPKPRNALPADVQMSLEFYTGFKLALDTLAKLGHQLELKVFDTKGQPSEVAQLAQKLLVEPVDVVVGPLYAKHAQDAAAILAAKQIPVFSPLSRGIDNSMHPNLIACIPSKKNEYIRVAQALSKEFYNQRIVFVNPDSPQNRAAVREIRKNMQATDSNTVVEIWASRARALGDVLHPNKENIFVVVDQNAAFLTDLVTKLFALKNNNIRLLSTNDLLQIETIEIRYLDKIRYTATELFYVDYSNAEVAQFVRAYRNLYNTEPSRFALQGFDLGLYIGGVLGANNGTQMLPEKIGFSTGYVFDKPAPNGGAQNRFVFLMELKDMKYRPFVK